MGLFFRQITWTPITAARGDPGFFLGQDTAGADSRLSGEDPIPDGVYDLLQNQSLFGRMLLIAARRNAMVDHQDVADNPPQCIPSLEKALKRLHVETFTKWLALSFQRQKADINVYLNLLPATERSTKIGHLIANAEKATPSEATDFERQLFVQDLKIVKALFYYDP